MAQLPVLPLPPTEHPPVHRERHGVLATRVHRHFLYHKLGERAKLARHRDVGAGVAEAEAAVGSLAAGVDLALQGDEKEGLGAAGNPHRVERG